MNITIHPSQWFHHRHLAGEHEMKRQWHPLLRNEIFWIVAIFVTFFAVATVLAILFGNTVPSEIHYMPTYMMH